MAQVTKNILQLVVQKIKSLFDKQQSQIDSIQAAVDNNSPLLVTYDGTSLSEHFETITDAINQNRVVIIGDISKYESTGLCDMYAFSNVVYTHVDSEPSTTTLIFTNISISEKYSNTSLTNPAICKIAEVNADSVFTKKTEYELACIPTLHFKKIDNNTYGFASFEDYKNFTQWKTGDWTPSYFDLAGKYFCCDGQYNKYVAITDNTTSIYIFKPNRQSIGTEKDYQRWWYMYDKCSSIIIKFKTNGDGTPEEIFNQLTYSSSTRDFSNLSMEIYWTAAQVITATDSTYTITGRIDGARGFQATAEGLYEGRTYLLVPFAYKQSNIAGELQETKCFAFWIDFALPQAGSGIEISENFNGTPNTVNVKIPATEEYITADSTGVHTTEALRTALSSAGGSSDSPFFVIKKSAWSASITDLDRSYDEIKNAAFAGKILILDINEAFESGGYGTRITSIANWMFEDGYTKIKFPLPARAGTVKCVYTLTLNSDGTLSGSLDVDSN